MMHPYTSGEYATPEFAGEAMESNCGRWMRCPECRATGERSLECVACGGTGTVACDACGGRGGWLSLKEASWSPCPRCRGTGTRGCVSCSGRGYGWETCQACAGTGYLPGDETGMILQERLEARGRA